MEVLSAGNPVGWEAITQTINGFTTVDDCRKPSIKVKGKEATVEHYNIDDYKRLLMYFRDKKTGNHWLHYLMLVMQTNTARRNSDVIKLRWADVIDPATGKFRDEIAMIEKKTGKHAAPYINDQLKRELEVFIQETGVNPSDNDYQNYIFTQYCGKNRGEVIGYNACYRAIKRAAEKLGIDYDVATHSARKFFGNVMFETHGNEHDAKDILQDVFNHSDSKVTNRYIGITKKRKNQYYADMGTVFADIVNGKYDGQTDLTRSYMQEELKELVVTAFVDGIESAGATDAEKFIKLQKLLENLENLAR